MKPALLIIDMQNAFLDGDHLPFDGHAVGQRINLLAAAARQAQIPVIWVQHEDDDQLRRESTAWQIHRDLEVHDADVRLRKTTPDAFLDTGLAERLQERQVDTLVVCGMQTEFCVDTTCRRALALGWPVLLAQDAHTTSGNAVLTAEQVIAHHNATLTAMTSFGPRVQTWPTEALLQQFQSSKE